MKIFGKRELRQQDSVSTELPQSPSADQIVLATQIRALEERLARRHSASEKEIRVLLRGAADVATKTGDVEKGKELLRQAQAAFDQSLQTVNRNWYLFALLMGVVGVALVGAGVTWLTSSRFPGLASPDTILALFTFAGMGSVTSVLIRLTSLDLKAELSRKFVIYLAIAKPLVAVSFASIVYVILKNHIITFGQWSGESERAVFWVAAFLCGFSERFASDILGRAIPSYSSHRNSPR
jgi:hypothetical protein